MVDPSVFDDVQVPDDEELRTVALLAEEQAELEVELANLAARTKELTKHYREISEEKLPEAMTDLGLAKVTLSNGVQIEIKDEIYASLTKKNQPEGFKWLREHGHGSIIKEQVVKETVHPQTLKAFVREQLGNGKPLPMQLFGVYEVTRAVIKN